MDNLTAEIIAICIELEIKAFKLYTAFAAATPDNELAESWRKLAAEEKEHMKFWKKARDFSSVQSILSPIDAPESTLDKLKDINTKIAELIAGFNQYGNPPEELMLAYVLEAYLLDPAFMNLFQSFAFINRKIGDHYDDHLKKFIGMMKIFGHDKLPLQLQVLSDILLNLYNINRRLAIESAVDPLTSLLNRRGFFNNARAQLASAARNNSHMSVIMTDLDNFKLLNKAFGHPAGDIALKTAAFLLSSSIRKSDLAGRYGGEEFIILSSAVDNSSLLSICERVRSAIEHQSAKLAGHHFTISIGAASGAVSPPELESLSRLIAAADECLHQAKTSGKNRCVIRENS